MRLANSSWSVFQPATSSVGSWPFAAGACVCVCICACTLIRPQDVNCNIPAHGPLAAHLGPGVYGKVMRYSPLASRQVLEARGAFTLSPRPSNKSSKASEPHSTSAPSKPQPQSFRSQSVYTRPQSPQTIGPIPRRGGVNSKDG